MDSKGAERIQRLTINVNNKNEAPVASAGGPYVLQEGIAFALQGSAIDPDANQTLVYQWDLNYNGSVFDIDATGPNPLVTFQDQFASRTIALRVTDSDANPLSNIATTNLSVQNRSPQLTRVQPSVSGIVADTLTATGTWSDVAADTVTLTTSVGSVLRNSDGTWVWTYSASTIANAQTVTINAVDEDGGTSQTTFTLDVLATTPKVTNVVFGDGTAQRSSVRSITVDFNMLVELGSNAFSLDRSDIFSAFSPDSFAAYSQALIGVSLSTLDAGTRTRAILTFSSSDLADPLRIIGGSLADGNYRLNINANAATTRGVLLDGNGDGTAGDNFARGNARTDQFFRLYGSVSANGAVTNADFIEFRKSLGKSTVDSVFGTTFDFNGNSSVENSDFIEFRRRLGRSRG